MIASLATTAPTQFLDIGGTRFAYRRFGTTAGTPLVFIQHFMGNLDNFDPAISDALAAGREIILFDNAGVGRSTGTAPGTIADMAADAASFIDGLGLTSVDILGHSMGGEIAQLITLDRPDLVRRLVLVGTGPRGGDAIARQAPEVAPLFTRRDELGEDMWLPNAAGGCAGLAAAPGGRTAAGTANLRDGPAVPGRGMDDQRVLPVPGTVAGHASTPLPGPAVGRPGDLPAQRDRDLGHGRGPPRRRTHGHAGRLPGPADRSPPVEDAPLGLRGPPHTAQPTP